jgi:hypothetical protein
MAGIVLLLALTLAPEPADTARSVEWLIASAVLAAPEPLRAGAEVRGWQPDGSLRTLREGSNGIICLADRPEGARFSVACYHDSLEPFMARGRQLTAQGINGPERDAMRWREIEAGTLHMPDAAMVYNLSFPSKDFDPATTNPATGARLYSLYLRGATPETLGLPAQPGADPWLMHPGTPSAHVMIGLPPRQP